MKLAPSSQPFLIIALLAIATTALEILATDPPEDESAASNAWTSTDTQLANHYIQTLQKAPEYGKVFNLLWELYEKKDQTKLLIDYFKGATESTSLTTQSVSIHLIYGHLLLKTGQEEEARNRYAMVVEVAPENIPALKALAEMADRQDRLNKALSLYNRLIPLVPINTKDGLMLRLRQAELNQAQGQIEKAVATWNDLLGTFPERSDLRTRIVSLLLQVGETESAIRILEALSQTPDPRQKLIALSELNRIYEFIGEVEKAADAAKRGLKLLHFKNHDYAELFARWVQIHERFDRIDELQRKLGDAAAGERPPLSALHDLAEFYRLTANSEKEEAAVARLVKQSPENLDYQIRLAKIQMANNRFDKASAILALILDKQPRAPLHLVLLQAEAMLGANEKQATIELLRSHLKDGPADPDTVQKVIAFAQQNFLDSMVEELLREEVIANTTAEADALVPIKLARFLDERGRQDQAIELIWEYVETSAERENERVSRLQQAAIVFRELKLPEPAIEAIEAALELDPNRLELLTTKADLLVDANRAKEAIQILSEVWNGTKEIKAKTEVDQRLFSLLRGLYTKDEPLEDFSVLNNGNIQTLAQYRKMAFVASKARRPGDEPPPEELISLFHEIVETANRNPSLESRYRAAWWAFKLQENHECYHQLTKATEEAGQPVLEIEQLLFSLAELNERRTHMIERLSNLAELDPENSENHLLRRAELRFDLGYEDEAVRTLKELAAKPGASLSTLNALAKLYSRQGNQAKQIDVWTQAYHRANAFEKRRIIKQLSTVLIENGQPEEALDAQLELLNDESDSQQQRRQLDTQINLARAHFLLDWLLEKYAALSRAQPLNRFFPEAIARIHLASGDTEEAFDAMKTAYYMSDRSDALLGELSSLADELGDLPSAIYFRRQLLNRSSGDDLENWQRLVEMLEKDLQAREADQLRLRLENRFGRDPEFLIALADHYEKDGQPAATQRVLENLVSLRDWDVKTRFRLALLMAEREQIEGAFKHFEEILSRTESVLDSEGVAAHSIPMLRVGQLSPDAKNSPGNEVDALVFSVEAFPFQGSNLQDEIAEFLQQDHPEYHYLPNKPAYLRLRAIEEMASLTDRSKQARSWLTDWLGGDQTDLEKAWAARHDASQSDFSRRLFVQFLESRPDRQTHDDHFQAALARVIVGDVDLIRSWIEENSSFGTPKDRSVYLALAAQIALSQSSVTLMQDSKVLIESLVSANLHPDVCASLVTQLGQHRQYDAAWRLGEALLSNQEVAKTDFYIEMARISLLAGHRETQVEALEIALKMMTQNRSRSDTRYFLIALTERLALMNSDWERKEFLERLESSLPSPDQVGLSRHDERKLLLLIAGQRHREAIQQLGKVVSRQVDLLRPRDPDPGEVRYDQSQRWQRLDQLLQYYSRRLPLDRVIGPQFVHALRSNLLALPSDESVIADYEQFEIDRQILALEFLDPPARQLQLAHFQSGLVDPHSRMELGKTLEARGFYRESIPVFLAETASHNRDYSPVQRLFDASAEALAPAAAIDLVRRFRSRQQTAPPGLTDDYLAEQHARFLMIQRNLERLIPLSRPSVGGRGSPPINTQNHLPYQEALIEVYRQMGENDALVRLLTHLKQEKLAEPHHLALGAVTLKEQGRDNDAIAWLAEVTLNEAEPEIARFAMLEAAHLAAESTPPDIGKMIQLARFSLEHHPPHLTRQLASIASEAGAVDESESVLRLLRRSSSNPTRRFEATLVLMQNRIASGDSVVSLDSEWESLFRDFNYEPRFREGENPNAYSTSPLLASSNGYIVASWFCDRVMTKDPAHLGEVLRATPAPPSAVWLRDLLVAFSGPEFEHETKALFLDLPRAEQEHLLETLPALGDEGSRIARQLVEAESKNGNYYFAGNPDRQILFFHRINDRTRLLEVHASLMREAQSDIFIQTGLEDHYATLLTRQMLPGILQAIGEPDLAVRLFRRYHEQISIYQWSHQPFIESYIRFLIETDQFLEAEKVLHKALQKSLRLDLRLLIELYSSWGKLDEWQARTAPLYLTEGRITLLNEWRTALAEGREMVDHRTPW
ncbi:MAG: tetratricopeptide repeat protein [Verrucomicrobiota bacterium]